MASNSSLGLGLIFCTGFAAMDQRHMCVLIVFTALGEPESGRSRVFLGPDITASEFSFSVFALWQIYTRPPLIARSRLGRSGGWEQLDSRWLLYAPFPCWPYTGISVLSMSSLSSASIEYERPEVQSVALAPWILDTKYNIGYNRGSKLGTRSGLAG